MEQDHEVTWITQYFKQNSRHKVSDKVETILDLLPIVLISGKLRKLAMFENDLILTQNNPRGWCTVFMLFR
jgi:hypothetical protein